MPIGPNWNRLGVDHSSIRVQDHRRSLSDSRRVSAELCNGGWVANSTGGFAFPAVEVDVGYLGRRLVIVVCWRRLVLSGVRVGQRVRVRKRMRVRLQVR